MNIRVMVMMLCVGPLCAMYRWNMMSMSGSTDAIKTAGRLYSSLWNRLRRFTRK